MFQFFLNELNKKIIDELDIEDNEILFIIGDKENTVLSALGALRIELANKENLIDNSKWAPLWVVDFPLVEWNEEKNR